MLQWPIIFNSTVGINIHAQEDWLRFQWEE